MNQPDNFDKQYRNLNEQQKLAVDSLEGPVMVIAGPGTGKTQILATRIGKILLETDTRPDNILCLTYTDNGAVEMRSRLLQIVGTACYNVRIHTFHSFCNEVIQDNPSFFGKLKLEPISDLQEVDLFYKLIDSIEVGNALKRYRGEVYYEKDRLKNLFSLMKKEAWTPFYINEHINEYLKSLPLREKYIYKRKGKGFVAGDLKVNEIKAETERMEVLRAAAHLYPRYNQLMADIGAYDFDDMILWVLDAFKKYNNLLLDYQERFLYFLVDEFQDTSRSQNLLLELLTGYWDLPNLFTVGDADQSIFSFQDANVENIHDFEKRYSGDLTKINLVRNYRSSQQILDNAHQLIIHNNLRTVAPQEDKPLIASKTTAPVTDSPVIIAEYLNETQESIDVVRQIEQLLASGINGKEIAVIYRKHAQVEEMLTMLESKKINVNIRRKVNLLQLPFVNSILTILTWIDRENYMAFSADDLLFPILHYEYFHIRPLEIARMSIAVNERNHGAKTDRYSLRRMIAEQQPVQADLFTPAETSFKAVSNMLESLISASNNITVQHLVERVIQKAGILSYIMEHPEKPWLMQVLNAFFGFIKTECKRQPEITLHGLLENIQKMRRGNISIPLYKVGFTDDAVNLMTAHGSKGSEFSHVFMIGCTTHIWDDSNGGGDRNYRFPDNLMSSFGRATDLEESRRLFYVSLTRAKSHLQISYPLRDKKEKAQVKSNFITEIMETGAVTTTQKEVADDLLVDYLALQFIERAAPEIALVEDAYLDQLLKKYTLSVTHLSNFLDCPLKFYYQNLIKVPSAKSESMVFGSAIHFALQRLFEKMRANHNIFPGKGDMFEDFQWYMEKNRDAFTPEEFKRRNEYGENILPAYYDKHIGTWNKVVVVEKAFRNITVQGVPLNGKLDKLEFTGGLVNVVDYKTGNYDNGRKKLVAPNPKMPHGGDYWRQAVFYKILIDHDYSNTWQASSTTFEFVEPVHEEYKSERLEVSHQDLTTVTQQIVQTWEKIQQKAFKTGCGKPDCHWCRFVKSNKLAVALHELVDEEEFSPF